MRSERRLLLCCVALAWGVATAADVLADETRELWDKNCASCHGPDGKGKTKSGRMLKVDDLTAAAVRAEFDREVMVKSIKEGIPKEEGSTKLIMPSYSEKLSEEQITSLVDFVEALGSAGSSDQE